MPKQKLTRKELYDLIWSKPLNKLAQEFEIKESRLRKICKDFDIPTPKSGYWKKLEFNKEVIVKQLPISEKWKEAVINIEQVSSESKEKYQSKLARRIEEIESEFPNEIKVSKRLTNPSPLVQRTKVSSEKEKVRNFRGYEEAIDTTSGYLSISVTKKNISRILRFEDSFIKLLEKRGGKVEVSGWDTFAETDGERFKIKFWEKQKAQLLLEHSIKWKTAQGLDLFINNIESEAKGQTISSEINDWLNWAKDTYKTINPLSEGIERFISRYHFDVDSMEIKDDYRYSQFA